MSQGCCFFTLKLIKPASGNKGFPSEVISVKILDWSKGQIVNISAKRPKMKKMRVLYFLKLLKFQKIKRAYIFNFWPLG